MPTLFTLFGFRVINIERPFRMVKVDGFEMEDKRGNT